VGTDTGADMGADTGTVPSGYAVGDHVGGLVGVTFGLAGLPFVNGNTSVRKKRPAKTAPAIEIVQMKHRRHSSTRRDRCTLSIESSNFEGGGVACSMSSLGTCETGAKGIDSIWIGWARKMALESSDVDSVRVCFSRDPSFGILHSGFTFFGGMDLP